MLACCVMLALIINFFHRFHSSWEQGQLVGYTKRAGFSKHTTSYGEVLTVSSYPYIHRFAQRSSRSTDCRPTKPFYASTTSSPSPPTYRCNRHWSIVDTESHGYTGKPSSEERLLGSSWIHLSPLHQLDTVYKACNSCSLGRTIKLCIPPSVTY